MPFQPETRSSFLISHEAKTAVLYGIAVSLDCKETCTLNGLGKSLNYKLWLNNWNWLYWSLEYFGNKVWKCKRLTERNKEIGIITRILLTLLFAVDKNLGTQNLVSFTFISLFYYNNNSLSRYSVILSSVIFLVPSLKSKC